MFCLVHNSMVIAGPIQWDSGFFNFALRGVNVVSEVPIPSTPVTGGLRLANDTKIVPCITVNEGDVNPLYQYYEGPLFEVSEDFVTARYVARQSPLESAKLNYKQLASEKRYAVETAGTKITLQGQTVTLDTTREGRNIFVHTMIIMPDNTTIGWKFPEVWLEVTKAELQTIVAAGAGHIQVCFAWEKQINEAIDAIQDPSEFEAIEATIRSFGITNV